MCLLLQRQFFSNSRHLIIGNLFSLGRILQHRLSLALYLGYGKANLFGHSGLFFVKLGCHRLPILLDGRNSLRSSIVENRSHECFLLLGGVFDGW